MSEPSCVLDASALLCYLRREPGAERVVEALDRGVAISAANWAEVLSQFALEGVDPRAVVQQLTAQGLVGKALQIVPLDASLACEAARLRPKTRSLGLSLADRACLSLARQLRVPVLTTDRAWRGLHLGVLVQTIR